MTDIYKIIYPRVLELINGASGRYPLLMGMKLNNELYVSVSQLCDTNSGRACWGLIFTEADKRGNFLISGHRGGEFKLDKRYVVNKHRGKKEAADIFTKIIVDRVMGMTKPE